MVGSEAARNTVLAAVRKALGHSVADQSRGVAVAARLASPPANPPASRTVKSRSELIAQFEGFLIGQSATVLNVASEADIPASIAAYLRSLNAPLRVRHGNDGLFTRLPWGNEPALENKSGAANPEDMVGLSRALAGVSETGTLVLASGPDNPVTINFLPEVHIVVLDASEVVASYEEAWSKVRSSLGSAGLSRTVNFISGPSRTGDIGGRLVMGAHGPKKLCVIVVGR